MHREFVQDFSYMQELIYPSYLLESPYRELLIATARGDGKISNIFKRAHIGDSLGGELISDLVGLGILAIEESRQAPLKKHPKYTIKKELRGYRIQHKVRFVKPYYRFWFAFVEPFRSDLNAGNSSKFIDNFHQHKDRAVSLVFEQLSNLLLVKYFGQKDPLISTAGYWDHYSEFDLLAFTKSGKAILGECKYTSRSVCKNELKKLKDKANISGLRVDIFALFSKSGFSKELHTLNDDNLLLFDMRDYDRLLVDQST